MYVSPKTDCKHVNVKNYLSLVDFEKIYDIYKQCENCEESKENWFCLTCGKFFCSRYINSHFLSHYEENKSHNVCISNMDLSIWCYECDYYIMNKDLNNYSNIASNKKFGNFIPNVDNLYQAFQFMKIEEEKARDIKYQILIEKFKEGHFKNITFLTGAGISTSAGIPDFRSSDSGLFKTLQSKYNLSQPEEFFFLTTFLEKPELFYEFAKEFDLSKYKPTLTHVRYIIYYPCYLVVHELSDSLELKAKIPREKIVYAHGHINEAHCPGCKIEIDIELQNNHIKEGKVLYCNDQSCNMPCKPKIVFYGEKLPDDFKEKSKTIGESDLTFIMGTSLMVSPFNMLPHFLSEDAWRVVINKEKVGSEGPSGFSYDDVLSRDIFIPGTTDDILKKLIMDCGWKQEFESFIESFSSE